MRKALVMGAATAVALAFNFVGAAPALASPGIECIHAAQSICGLDYTPGTPEYDACYNEVFEECINPGSGAPPPGGGDPSQCQLYGGGFCPNPGGGYGETLKRPVGNGWMHVLTI